MDVLHESRHMSCATAESLLCDASVPARSRDEWKNPPFLPNWASTAGRPRASCPSPSPEKLFILFGLKYMQSDPLTSIPICICIVADFFLPKIIGCTSVHPCTSTGSAPAARAWFLDGLTPGRQFCGPPRVARMGRRPGTAGKAVEKGRRCELVAPLPSHRRHPCLLAPAHRGRGPRRQSPARRGQRSAVRPS